MRPTDTRARCSVVRLSVGTLIGSHPFDREGQGFINAAEMRHVLTSLGMRPTDTRARCSVVRLSVGTPIGSHPFDHFINDAQNATLSLIFRSVWIILFRDLLLTFSCNFRLLL